MPLCPMCEQITPWTTKPVRFDRATLPNPKECNQHYPNFNILEESALDCELCRLMYKSLLRRRTNLNRQVQPDAPILLGNILRPFANSKIHAPQVSDILVSCGEIWAELHAFADPKSAAARSNAVTGRLPLEPGSAMHFEMITKWVQDCEYNHPACRADREDDYSDMRCPEGANLPRRVLDLGETNNSKIHLIEPEGMVGRYVTLSHRWSADPATHFKTTLASIDDRKRGIDFETLPPTFKDAIIMTRKLKFRYLWIDSLSIVQDDLQDWDEQSIQMGQIYNNCTVTIMAATDLVPQIARGQQALHEGFLHPRSQQSFPTVELEYYDRNWKQDGTWSLQYMDRDRFHSFNLDLLTRGWVMQENLLSRRRVIFTPDQVLWHCRTMKQYEVSRGLKPSLDRYPDFQCWEDVIFVDHWLSIVEDFSAKALTFEADKLPALSGLASFFCQRHNQEYYAGVFSGGIAEGLLWGPWAPGCLSRPTQYIAPSWSWTSLNGRIKTRAPLQSDDGFSSTRSALENISFKLFPVGLNPYGRLKGGQIEVTGWLRNADMVRTTNDAQLLMELRVMNEAVTTFVLDLAEFAPVVGCSQEVVCLYVLEDNANVLVLRKDDSMVHYERIGIAVLDPAWFVEGSPGARKKCITII